MYCPNCGTQTDVNFCPNCGADLRSVTVPAPAATAYPPLKQPYVVMVNSKEIDLNKIIRMYGYGVRRIGAYAYLQTQTGISNPRAKEILDPVYAAHEGEKTSVLDGVVAQSQEDKPVDQETWRREANELDAAGTVYCPKCHSTNITAQKRGFGVIRGLVGGTLLHSAAAGAVVGAAGSNKVLLTCMKCGHQWKPK